MPRAFNLIRSEVHYRSDAINAGLRAAGYDLVDERRIGTPQPSDVLVIWNRYAHWHELAKRFEAAGSAVIVAENGYLGRSENAYAKPYTTDEQEPEDQLYALALNHHNGAGRWWIDESRRWRQQGIEVKPWRRDGEHVLVLPQRGIGPARVAMPPDWSQTAVRRLQALTRRPVRLRPHPGNAPAEKPLQADLEGAWCAVTWGSGAALKAVCAGIPVFGGWPKWIGLQAAMPFGSDVEIPLCCDVSRTQMLDRLAWAQWSVGEIRTGEPFRRLLTLHHERPAAA